MKCKKILAMLLSGALAASLCACGGEAASSEKPQSDASAAPVAAAQESPVQESSAEPAQAETSAQEEAPRAVISYPLTGDDLTITMSFDIHGTEELNTLMAKIRQIDGVLDIERTTG